VMDPLLHLSADGPLDEPTAAALLRLSDPATSSTFLEGYLGLPIDASRMLLVLDLPSADLLPAGLRERALELPLEGYAPSERLAILRDVLWPRAQRECGLRGRGVRLPDNVLEWLVKERTREAGVLELNKLAHQLARRLARRKLNGQASLEWSLEAVKACLGEAPPAPREAALE
jgi:ATP-dependent Lon protease